MKALRSAASRYHGCDCLTNGVFKLNRFNSKVHDRANFSCGESSLDHYIKQRASQDVKKQVSAAFVLVDKPDAEVLATGCGF